MADTFESNKTKPVKENFVEGVLQNYLDQLLVVATEPQSLAPVVKTEVVTDVVTDVAARIIPEPVLDTVTTIDAPTIAVATDIVTEVVAEIDTGIATQEEQQPLEQKIKHLTDQDSWSSQGVECLIFRVCGLSLAVPLLFLGGVHEIEKEDIKPLMGQPKWYLGMLHTDEGNLQVIDTANFIMPERSCNLSTEGFKYLIRLEKTPWAIACQSIDATVRLEASEIKWRGDRGKRTWLAGTVIKKMCALVDVSGLLQRVETNCRPS